MSVEKQKSNNWKQFEVAENTRFMHSKTCKTRTSMIIYKIYNYIRYRYQLSVLAFCCLDTCYRYISAKYPYQCNTTAHVYILYYIKLLHMIK